MVKQKKSNLFKLNFLLVSLVLLLLIPLINSFSLTTFSDSSSSGNLTFTSAGSQIKNLSINKDANITSATLDLKGYIILTYGLNWTSKADALTKRRSSCGAVVNNKLYVIGGQIGASDTDKVEEYDPSTNVWTTKTVIPLGKHDLECDAVGDIIYVFGGYPNREETYAYNVTSNSWSTKTDLPIPVSNSQVCAYDERIFVFGGYNNTGNGINNTQIYNTSSNTWGSGTKWSESSAFMYGGGCYKYGDSIYVISRGVDVTQNDIWEYNVTSDSWTDLSDSSCANSGSLITGIDDIVYLIGGSSGMPGITNSICRYNITSGNWLSDNVISSARTEMSGGVINNKTYITTGYDTSDVNITEEGTIWHYPTGVTIDTNNDGNIDYENLSTFNGSVNDIDLNITALQNCVDACVNPSGDNCSCEINFTSQSPGILEYSDINIQGNIPPEQPSLTNPSNNSYHNSQITFNWTTSTDADGDTVNYYILLNRTQICYTTDLNCSYTPASDSYYQWNVTPFDGTVNGTTSISRYFTYDTTNPRVNYTLPTPANDTRKITNSETINVSYYDLNFDTCILQWQGTNETFTSSNSTNFWETKATTDGTTYNFQVFCNDSAGNINDTKLRTFRENAKPTLASVSINDSSPTDSVDLKCENGTTIDSDNDTVSFTYDWYNNSIAKGINNSVLAFGNTTSGDSWYCSMIPQDGYEDGTIKYSATVSIGTGFLAPVVTNTNATTALTNINSTSTNPTNNNSWINLSTDFTDANVDESWTVYFCNVTDLTSCKAGNYFCKSSLISTKNFSCKYNVSNETSRIFTYYPQIEDNNSMSSGSGTSNTFEINYPPLTPNGTYPTNESFIKTNYTFINFSGSDTDSDTINYTAWGGTDQTDITTLIYNGTNAYFNWTDLTETMYYWKFKTTDQHGYDSFENSSIYSFTIDTTNPVLTVSSPTATTYYTTSISLIQTASDTNLDSCFYYVLYADTLSVYKSNTTITCNSTTSVSMAIYSGGYAMYVIANDSAGNLDTEEINFTIATSPIDGAGGGGRRPEIIFVEEGNFTVETEFGSSYYRWQAVPGSEKKGKIIIKNLGLEKITVSISCVPLGNESNGYDVCSLVDFSRTENIEVYPGGKLEETINFKINIPEEIEYGEILIFGIVVEDHEGHRSTPLHVETKIGRWIGFLSLFFEKMFSGFYTIEFSRYKPEARDVSIPYIIPTIFATMIFGFLTTWIVGKIRFKSKFLSNIKIGTSVFSIFVFFIGFLIII